MTQPDTQPDTNETTVMIPGTVDTVYVDGVITKLTFTPHAGGAGHFGPSAVIFSGDESLDVESTEGPFWSAVQTYLADSGIITWEE